MELVAREHTRGAISFDAFPIMVAWQDCYRHEALTGRVVRLASEARGARLRGRHGLCVGKEAGAGRDNTRPSRYQSGSQRTDATVVMRPIAPGKRPKSFAPLGLEPFRGLFLRPASTTALCMPKCRFFRKCGQRQTAIQPLQRSVPKSHGRRNARSRSGCSGITSTGEKPVWRNSPINSRSVKTCKYMS